MMRSFVLSRGLFAVISLVSTAVAQEGVELPKPTAEHEWLTQLEGDWSTEVQMFMDGQTTTSKGKEQVRTVGDFWTMAEHQGDFMGQPFTGVQTLGYDAEKGKFVGTWIDSVSGYFWVYEGELDGSKKKLTLRTKGHCPMNPGELSNFEEVIELKGPDHKVFTSSVQGKDGKWTKGMQIDSHRQ